MPLIEEISADINSKEIINQQLQKIISDPIFAVSNILRRFLSFIVEETLAGHSNQLKEYTIGVKVLNKPTDFQPQKDAIVRIHAGRLRRALSHYYKKTGSEESIRISIPKGSYIPVFGDKSEELPEEYNELHAELAQVFKKSTVFAVLPFRHFEKDRVKAVFADGLGVQLSGVLTGFENISVIAYYSMRSLVDRVSDVKEVASAVGAHYVITGDMQSQEDCVRINVQLINTDTNEQTWSEMYECKLSASTMFDMQDNIVKQVTSSIGDYYGFTKRKPIKKLVMAVA